MKTYAGKIEDFFKLCKSGLGLKKLQKYLHQILLKKTTTFTVLFVGIITTQGYNSKTALKKLFET